MILTADYHTHTPYSHGKNTVAENAKQAKEIGLQELGIADHGFLHLLYGISRKAMQDYKRDCHSAQEEYGIKVLVGVEANILGSSGKCDLEESDYDDFELFLCGKHLFVAYENGSNRRKYGVGNALSAQFHKTPSAKLIAQNTTAYINAIKNNPIDVLTHLNHRCPSNALEVAKCAADYGTYIELNSQKNHLTDEELMEIADKTSARFLINSDAHTAARVGDYKLVAEQLARLRFPMERIDNIDGRTPNFRFSAYKNGR